LRTVAEDLKLPADAVHAEPALSIHIR